MESKAKALVVLSGGQDSTTCLHLAIQKYGRENVYAITFDYGQRHSAEIEAAKIIADMANIADHEIICVSDCLVSVSPLTSTSELEKYTDYEQMDNVIGKRVELTFVPMRNTLFLTIAFNRAVKLGCTSIFTGICQEDNANYPDCTDVFKSAFQSAANKSLGDNHEYIFIEAPLMYMSKADTVRIAKDMPECWIALAYSHTSYDGKYPPTDMNHSNVLRAHGFEEAGLPDPLVVRAWFEGLMELPATTNYDSLRGEGSQE